QCVDSKPCTVLKNGDRDELWLDPSVNFAVRKRLWRRNSSPNQPARLILFEAFDFEQASTGIYLPHRVRITDSVVDPVNQERIIVGVSTLIVDAIALGEITGGFWDVGNEPGSRIAGDNGR